MFTWTLASLIAVVLWKQARNPARVAVPVYLQRRMQQADSRLWYIGE